MLPLQDIAALKLATVICNDPDLKRKILFKPDDLSTSGSKYLEWNEIVEKQAMVTLRSLRLPKILQEKIMGVVPAIGMRMLSWAVYHENILMFSREYSIDFLNSSFFTQRGVIDSRKAAEELMKDESLGVEQKYKIACLYCFTDHILPLFKRMTKEDRNKLCSIGSQSCSQPELVRFWSDYFMGEVDKVRGEKTLEQYRLEKAIQSGSKAAVEYFFKRTNLRMKKEIIVDAALEAVRNRIMASAYYDWFVFRDLLHVYNNIPCDKWVPSEYYVGIVCFLLSKMTKKQKIEFLRKDIEGIKYPRHVLENDCSRVLEYFSNWQYRGYFKKTAEQMRKFLPEKNYADLLLRICDKIEPAKVKYLKFGEEKSYDYRGLLKDFWYQSPECYKRYVLTNQRTQFFSTYNPGVKLLVNLLSLKRFTFEDGQIIGIILASVEDNNKAAILSSEKWRSVLIGLIKEGKLEILDRIDRFVLSHLSSTQVNAFKRELIFSRDFGHVVCHFVKNDKWDAVESALKWSSLSEKKVNEFKKELIFSGYFKSVVCHFVESDNWDAAESALKWSSLSGEDVIKFKKELIYSEDGKRTCLGMCIGNLETATKFIEWCIALEEEIGEYKKKLILSIMGVQSLVLKDKLELIYKIANCWLFSQEKIEQFKDEFQLLMGHDICEKLISGYSKQISQNGVVIIFEGGKWGEVEQFLTWCFSSEEEIVDFKKRLLWDSGEAVLLNLIISTQWAEAETFFAWLVLSIEEIKKLKRDTVLGPRFIRFFRGLMSCKEAPAFTVYYRSKKETIELILRWCLSDRETALEFKDTFKNLNGCLNPSGDVLKNFDLIIEQRLKDIHEEKMGVKRKSETVFSPGKKVSNFQLECFD